MKIGVIIIIELNKVYCADNIEILKQIEDNSIQLIYCDILFNTGRNFKDYNDNLGTANQAIEWYRPRIEEMHRVLKGTGLIYIHCDWHLVHYLKVMMDSIFGVKQFRNEIIWSYDRWTNSSKDFTRCHDTILRYSKTDNYFYNKQYEPFSDKSKHKGSRFSKHIENGKLEQVYVSDERKKAMKDVWNVSILNSQAKERVGYDTQKPKELISRIIESSSNQGDIVADFFCGSGTSLVVAKELNRRFIGCDINEKAIGISLERLNKEVS